MMVMMMIKMWLEVFFSLHSHWLFWSPPPKALWDNVTSCSSDLWSNQLPLIGSVQFWLVQLRCALCSCRYSSLVFLTSDWWWFCRKSPIFRRAAVIKKISEGTRDRKSMWNDKRLLGHFPDGNIGRECLSPFKMDSDKRNSYGCRMNVCVRRFSSLMFSEFQEKIKKWKCVSVMCELGNRRGIIRFRSLPLQLLSVSLLVVTFCVPAAFRWR